MLRSWAKLRPALRGSKIFCLPESAGYIGDADSTRSYMRSPHSRLKVSAKIVCGRRLNAFVPMGVTDGKPIDKGLQKKNRIALKRHGSLKFLFVDIGN